MSNRLSKRQKTGGFNHTKGNTPYKYYRDKEWIQSQLIPYDDYKHLNSINAKDYTKGIFKETGI